MFEPSLSDDNLHALEKERARHDVVRHAALQMLTQDDLELMTRLCDQNGFSELLGLMEDLGEYLTWRTAETDLLESARTRLWTVLKERIHERLDGRSQACLSRETLAVRSTPAAPHTRY